MSRLPLAAAFVLSAATLFAHCQVPCGIYADQRRFELMLEDEHTISKAQTELGDLIGVEVTPQTVNQMVRWTTTKEEHAQRVQQTMLDYFLAQRIKADGERYEQKLKSAHAVIVAAMKCKQSADPDTAKTLEDAIFDFYRAYEGKEPDFDHEH